MANNNSAMAQSLYKLTGTNEYSYSIPFNLPNGSKQIVEVSPDIELGTGVDFDSFKSRQVRFKIPRYGLLERVILKSTFTTFDSTDDKMTGTKLFSDISLRSKNSTIVSNNPLFQQAYIRNMPIEQSAVFLELVDGLTPTTGIYTPFFCSFFENPANWLDTSFCEQLELQFTVNSSYLQVNNATAAATGWNTKLYCVFRNLDDASLRKLQTEKFGTADAKQDLTMLSWNIYAENELSSATAKTDSINLNCPFPSFKTYFDYWAPVAADDSGAARGDITSFSLTFAGRKVYDNIDAAIVRWDQSFFGACNLHNVTPTAPTLEALKAKNLVTLNHCDFADNGGNSGLISFSNTSGPVLEVTHGALASGIVRVVHQYFQSVIINGADGSIVVSSSL